MKILIHVHAYYAEFLQELASCISSIAHVCGEDAITCWVTYPDFKYELEGSIKSSFPRAKILPLPNVGYDIAPFIEVLHRESLSNYDYIVKLHTKRDKTEYHYLGHIQGGEWRRRLISFCSNITAARRSLTILENNKSIGMIAGRKELDPSGLGVFPDITIGDAVLAKLGLKRFRHDVIYGTMFIVRSKLMSPFLKLKFSDFPPPPRGNPHAIPPFVLECEWALPRSISAQGQYVLSGNYPIWLELAMRPLKRFAIKVIRCIIETIRQGKLKLEYLFFLEKRQQP